MTGSYCQCDIKSGYIDGSTGSVRCNNCDKVIKNTEHVTLERIKSWNDEFNRNLHYGHHLDVRDEHHVWCSECEMEVKL